MVIVIVMFSLFFWIKHDAFDETSVDIFDNWLGLIFQHLVNPGYHNFNIFDLKLFVFVASMFKISASLVPYKANSCFTRVI